MIGRGLGERVLVAAPGIETATTAPALNIDSPRTSPRILTELYIQKKRGSIAKLPLSLLELHNLLRLHNRKSSNLHTTSVQVLHARFEQFCALHKFVLCTDLCFAQFCSLHNFVLCTILCFTQFCALNDFVLWTIMCFAQFCATEAAFCALRTARLIERRKLSAISYLTRSFWGTLVVGLPCFFKAQWYWHACNIFIGHTSFNEMHLPVTFMWCQQELHIYVFLGKSILIMR